MFGRTYFLPTIMAHRPSSHPILLFSWFALLLSVCVTADIVIDLFEETAGLTVAASSESTEPTPGEVENALENLLLPSAKHASIDHLSHVFSGHIDARDLFHPVVGEPDGRRSWHARTWVPGNSPPSAFSPLRI